MSISDHERRKSQTVNFARTAVRLISAYKNN